MTLPSLQLPESEVWDRIAKARLPAMPHVLFRLNERCHTEMIQIADLAELIAKDAAITSRILEAANHGSRKGQFTSLEQALIALGIDTVRMLVLHESAFFVFDHASRISTSQLAEFWKHSFSAAVIAQMIALHVGYPNIEEAYLGGLLHDIGRLALLATGLREDTDASVSSHSENAGNEEQPASAINHCHNGARLIRRWHLDSFLADSVLYHHESVTRIAKAHSLIRIVWLAHLLADLAEDEAPPQDAVSVCGIEESELNSIRLRAAERVSQAALQLRIDNAGQIEELKQECTIPRNSLADVSHLLSRQMHHLVLISEAGRSFVRRDNLLSLLESILQSAHMLFEWDDAIILLTDEAGLSLKGVGMGERRRRLGQFSIPLNNGGNIARAVMEERPTMVSADDGSLGIAEEQLLCLLGADCLIGSPLLTMDGCVGVLIGAVERIRAEHVARNNALLEAFSSQAGIAIRRTINQHSQSTHHFVTATEKYRSASRQLAHEVNNPLSLIKNYLDVLDRKLVKQEAVSLEISILHEEIDRISQIINDFADLPLEVREAGTDVSRVVNDVVRLFQETEYLPPTVRIISGMRDEPMEVDINADALKQILVNLFKNAVEALPNGGLIEVRNNGFVNRDGQLYVELLLKDTGSGIPSDVMADLFQPVRTTKGLGHRGLGLSIVYSLLKESRGLITCRSGSGGTTFEILIPASTSGEAKQAMENQGRYQS